MTDYNLPDLSYYETAYGDRLRFSGTEREEEFIEHAFETGESPPAIIHSDGRQLRPIFDLAGSLIDECVLEIDADGIAIDAVDPANVAMLGNFRIHADGLRDYDYFGEDENASREVGINVGELRARLNNARYGKSSKDPVRIIIGEYKALVTVMRRYDGTGLSGPKADGFTVPMTDELRLLDPASVRGRPDIPDFDLGWKATVPTDALADVVNHVYTHLNHRHIEISSAVSNGGNDLVLSSLGDEGETTVAFEDCATAQRHEASSGDASLLSLDYAKDVLPSIADAYIDTVDVRWDAEFPVMFHFEREQALPDDETGMLVSGDYMQAPRIQSD